MYFNYVIYASTGVMKCFGCGRMGHLIRACPDKREKSDASEQPGGAGEGRSAGIGAGGAVPASPGGGGAVPASPGTGGALSASSSAGVAGPASPGAGGTLSASSGAGVAVPASPGAGGVGDGGAVPSISEGVVVDSVEPNITDD